MRGKLTNKIKAISLDLLGYEISVKELRLMPYLQYILMNEKKIKPGLVNQEEFDLLKIWQNKGYICSKQIRSDINVTKEFWDIINTILYYSYVNIEVKE